MSTGQLIVTIAAVGLLGALHLVLRAGRVPTGAATVAAPLTGARREPLVIVLVLAALGALAFAGVAFVVSIVDEDEEVTAPATQPTTTVPTTTAAPPPPQPPPPAPVPLEPPGDTALVARVVTDSQAAVTATRNRVGDRVRVVKRETGVYAVSVPGLSPELRRRSAIRARPVNGTPGIQVSVRRVGPRADFMVSTRDAQSGGFVDSGFEFAVFLPKQAVEGALGEEDEERLELPSTR